MYVYDCVCISLSINPNMWHPVANFATVCRSAAKLFNAVSPGISDAAGPSLDTVRPPLFWSWSQLGVPWKLLD